MPIHGFPGGVISSTAVTPSVSSASGVWTLDEQLQAGANWPVAPSFVNNSLRFRSSASANLSRTPSSAGNRQTWTWSAWVKRGTLSSGLQCIFSGGTGTSDTTVGFIWFTSTDALAFSGFITNFRITSQLFRDPSAWYHIVVAFDATQATAQNRCRIYVNGTEVTAFQTNNTITQNTNYGINQAQLHAIAFQSVSAGLNYFDGYITDVNFIDGQALTPNYFGAIDAATGVWEPATYRGTYGTNGFYLPFNLNTTPTFGGFTGDISSSFNTLPTGSQGSNFQFTGNFTIEGWVLFPSASTGDGSFYVSSDGSGFLAFNIDVAGGVYNIYMNSGVPTAIISHGIQAGAWTHVAMVRSGSTVTLYTNGVARGSFTNSSTVGYSTLTLNRFGGGASGQRFISNVRAVKAAVYTSAFTPPTSPLTSIANTLFLTYQNSTAIDNGPNAFALGTTGTVTFSTQYPFTLNIASDQSGNGNNWTTNNISLANNSTFDSMTDVPTLTSATASNFAVLNPLYNYPAPRLSNANLTTSNNGTTVTGALSTIGVTSGKWYFEATNTTTVNQSTSIGIVDSTFNFNAGAAYIIDGTTYRITGNPTFATYTNGDTIGVAFDADASTISFYKNGTLQGTGNYGYLTNGTPVFPYVYIRDDATGAWNANFGQRPFAYTPPTGFVALNTFNLPTPTIGATASTQANKYFNPVLYTGTGSTRTQTGVGFQPDFTWVKRRDGVADHGLMDSVRGATRRLQSNLTVAEDGFGFTAFAPDGFTFDGGIHNNSGWTFVAWNWKAGNSTVTNTAGSISAQVRANTSSGFSVVTYTGTGSAGATVGHGLGVAPAMIIIKNRTTTPDWLVYHKNSNANPDHGGMFLNRTDAFTDDVNYFNDTYPSSISFAIGSNDRVNTSGNNYVAYCFSEIAGYSRFGSYTGNGSTDGPFVFTGFRPRFVMIKQTSSTNDWGIFDTARNTFNSANNVLYPNLSNAEGAFSAGQGIDILSNGFKARLATPSLINTTGATYIYMAFAESPFKYANAR